MKKKDLEQFKNKTIKEMEEFVKTKEQNLLKSTLDLKSGRVKNVRIAKNIRRDLAQIKTILQEKVLGL